MSSFFPVPPPFSLRFFPTYGSSIPALLAASAQFQSYRPKILLPKHRTIMCNDETPCNSEGSPETAWSYSERHQCRRATSRLSSYDSQATFYDVEMDANIYLDAEHSLSGKTRPVSGVGTPITANHTGVNLLLFSIQLARASTKQINASSSPYLPSPLSQ